jgi:hypothetical protein
MKYSVVDRCGLRLQIIYKKDLAFRHLLVLLKSCIVKNKLEEFFLPANLIEMKFYVYN